jgi:hypothetical protein
MARNIAIAPKNVDKTHKKVASLPPKPKELSVKDAIRQLYDDVADAIMNKGYEAREVYALVAEELEVSDETVKAYYNDIRNEKAQEEKVTSLEAHRKKAGAGKAAAVKRTQKKR